MEVEIVLADVVGRITFFVNAAPKATAALRAALPINDRALQVKWLGDAWRTEHHHNLGATEIENEGHVLAAGDVIYFPRSGEIAAADGRAEWRHPDASLVMHVSVIGKVTANLEELVKAGQRVWIEGAQPLRLSRAR